MIVWISLKLLRCRDTGVQWLNFLLHDDFYFLIIARKEGEPGDEAICIQYHGLQSMYVHVLTIPIIPSQSSVLGPFLDSIMESAIHLQKVKLCERHSSPLLQQHDIYSHKS